MLVWWLSEVVPMAITALLPLLLFSMGGLMSMEDCLVSYSDKYVFLFLAGFILALAIEKWNLHRYFAQFVLDDVGAHAYPLKHRFVVLKSAATGTSSTTAWRCTLITFERETSIDAVQSWLNLLGVSCFHVNLRALPLCEPLHFIVCF